MKFFTVLVSLCLFFSTAQGQTTPDAATAYRSDTTVERDWDDDDGMFSISPNPSSNFIKVKSKGAPPDAISVHDIAGTKLMEDKSGRILNVYSLPRGIYFVHIRSGKRVERIRFEKL